MASTEAAPSALPAQRAGRIISVDALRGFDMFWIVGAETIVEALDKLGDNKFFAFCHTQLRHVRWEGLRFYDIIFPLFVFLIGASIVFSLTRQVAKEGKPAAYKRLLRRAPLIYFFGFFYDGGFADMPDENPFIGVMQRLAICYFFTSLLFLNLKKRGLAITAVILLVGYWALMTFMPFPGRNPENLYAIDANYARYIDSLYLPFREPGQVTDPEGLLSNLPAIASCILGVFAGLLLMDPSIPPKKKALYLFGAGLGLLALGYLWGLQFPIVKRIWTSSYVLVVGGYSCLLLGFFYTVIDLWGFQRWAAPFVWIGANPLTIYIASSFVPFDELGARLIGGPFGRAVFGKYDELVVATAATLLMFLFVRFLYRRQIFLRV